MLLDFHQDLYNERYQGNGAPDWAIVGRAAQEGRGVQAGFPSNYLVNDQLNHAYDAFWNNTPVPGTGRGVQDHYAAAWAQVAQRFRRSPGIAGYNLFNEPWQGTDVQRCAFAGKATSPDGDCPAANEFDRTKLTDFHRRVIAAIRGADRRTLAWWAPVLTFDFGLRTSHGDTGDRNAGFAFNSYCGQADPLTATILPFARGKPCSYTAELTFDNAEIVRRRTGDALLNTEYGASDNAKNWIDYAAAADRHMVGWHYWAYCGCNDPTTSAQPPDAQGVVLDPARPPSGANVKAGEAAADRPALPVAGLRRSAPVEVPAQRAPVPAAVLDPPARHAAALGARRGHQGQAAGGQLPRRLHGRRPGRPGGIAAGRADAAAEVLPRSSRGERPHPAGRFDAASRAALRSLRVGSRGWLPETRPS